MASKRPFVKAESTTVAPEKSRMEIEMMLRRYGAVGFSFSQNLVSGDATVDFIVPDSKAKDAPRIPVRIPVNCYDVYDALFGAPTQWDYESRKHVPRPRPYTHDPKRVLQAERVAWRNLVLWIDAALSAATIGLRTIAETFAGDRLVTDESGQTMRVQELLERANGALPMGGRLLLLGSGRPGPMPDETTRTVTTDAYRYARLGELQEWWREIAPPDEAGNEYWLPVEGPDGAGRDGDEIAALLNLAAPLLSRIAALEVPAAFALYEITGSSALGRWTDTNGAESVRRYRLVRTAR